MNFKKETEFVTKNTYDIEAKLLSDVTDVSQFKNGENLHLISFTNTHVVSGYFSEEKKITKEGVVSKETLDKIVESPDKFESLLRNDNSLIYFVNKEFIPYFKKYGENYSEMITGGEKQKHVTDFMNKEVFKDCDNKDCEFIQFVNNNLHIKVWKNTKGEVFMPPMFFDYIGANLDNGTYHLDELVEHLMKRDDVAFVANNGRWDRNKTIMLTCPLNGNEEGVAGIISDIPGYNSEEGRDETLSVFYYPKAEDINKILEWKEGQDNKYIWNIENFVVRVIMEGDQFSKKPVVVEQPVVQKRKFKS